MTINDPKVLFAIPYAGGNSLVYRNLKPLLGDEIDLVALEPPGRGKRLKDPLLTDIESIALDMYEQIKHYANERSFALLGHSMGALLAYLITRLSESDTPGRVEHIFCSAHGAPSVPKVAHLDILHYKAATEDFWAYIESLGALPPELKEHQELMNFFEPIVRADIQALECYRYQNPSEPLDIPITVFYGTLDVETPIHALIPWQNETKYSIEFNPQKGGHFAFFDEINHVGTIIRKTLLK
jgi:surfactin synthase thioesterase subunit